MIDQSLIGADCVLPVLTATSKTSLLPPFWVVRAFKISGRVSVSNLTADCLSAFINANAVQLKAFSSLIEAAASRTEFSRTVDNSSNDLMNLANPGISAGESSRESWKGVLS